MPADSSCYSHIQDQRCFLMKTRSASGWWWLRVLACVQRQNCCSPGEKPSATAAAHPAAPAQPDQHKSSEVTAIMVLVLSILPYHGHLRGQRQISVPLFFSLPPAKEEQVQHVLDFQVTQSCAGEERPLRYLQMHTLLSVNSPPHN